MEKNTIAGPPPRPARSEQPAPGLGAALRALVRGMRPQQYSKNLVVLTPALFGQHYDARTVALTATAFLAFCAASSATYLVNDAIDVEADRAHPVKRSRPLAAGLVPVSTAVATAGVLAAAGLALAFAVGPALGAALLGYLALQAAYNARLKREPIVDVMAVALGFVLRALGAGAATGIVLSGWFLLCVALLALYLGIEKRKSELTRMGATATTRAVLGIYTTSLLSRMEGMVAASALMSYSLWAAQRVPDHTMLATVPMVAYVMFRYQMLSENGSTEAPELAMARSPHIVLAVALWGLLSAGILLLHSAGTHLPVCASNC
ncbi:MAG TPA: decaprenyl-phosphate phosphoribosyltransferase [Candidatus Dormibacteraeota bacterium]|nr:decaprenyl-phosphate phosphoribosyltransferase [Candidatus Dormibacteraeota bacterium]